VKGYSLLYPSTDRIIIERIVQFEENFLHAPLEPHAEAYIPLLALEINDDEYTHSNNDSYLSFESDS
jgi:hypothetical protein